jgi:hypothetical protein
MVCQGTRCLELIKNLTLKIHGQGINGTATTMTLSTAKKSLATLQAGFRLWTLTIKKYFQFMASIVKTGTAQMP